MRYPMESEVEKALDLAKLYAKMQGRSEGNVLELHVSHAESLRGLRNFPDLEILILSGCGSVKISELTHLGKLISLRIHDSDMASLEGVENLEELSVLSVQRNRIVDVSVLLDANASLIEVEGNPLSVESYGRISEALIEQGRRVHRSGPREWSVTARLQEAGIPLCCYKKRDSYFLSGPGLSLTRYPERGHPQVEIEEIESLLERDPGAVLDIFLRNKRS
ncbi:Leucine-rich repeat (LRR) protein [Streptomyces filamentosus]